MAPFPVAWTIPIAPTESFAKESLGVVWKIFVMLKTMFVFEEMASFVYWAASLDSRKKVVIVSQSPANLIPNASFKSALMASVKIVLMTPNAVCANFVQMANALRTIVARTIQIVAQTKGVQTTICA
jgi:hypothetical protein